MGWWAAVAPVSCRVSRRFGACALPRGKGGEGEGGLFLWHRAMREPPVRTC